MCSRSLVGIAGSNPSRGGGHGCLPLVNVVCIQLEVSATGRSFVQRNPIECGVSECDREASKLRSLWPTRECRAMGKRYLH